MEKKIIKNMVYILKELKWQPFRKIIAINLGIFVPF